MNIVESICQTIIANVYFNTRISKQPFDFSKYRRNPGLEIGARYPGIEISTGLYVVETRELKYRQNPGIEISSNPENWYIIYRLESGIENIIEIRIPKYRYYRKRHG